jgi:flavin reductase (DIM6/NTAB) family NADH-FMN oxidoreductase RutF
MRPAFFDTADFRKALGTFVTGVTVVTTLQEDGTPRGLTANSFTSVSLTPPLVLVCISKTAASSSVFAVTDHYAVSILAEQQKSISSLFASKAPDKFERVHWQKARNGSPIIAHAAAWFECKTYEAINAGDHLILLGQVLDFGHTHASPLGYFRGAYLDFSLAQDAVAAASRRTRVGAILEREGSILFLRQSDGTIRLPVGSSLGPATDKASLQGLLADLELDARLSFLFSVFENCGAGDNTVSVFYRGTLEGTWPAQSSAVLIPFEQICFEALPEEVRGMVRRFVRERSEDTFGLYVGDLNAGTIQVLAGPAHPWRAGSAN